MLNILPLAISKSYDTFFGIFNLGITKFSFVFISSFPLLFNPNITYFGKTGSNSEFWSLFIVWTNDFFFEARDGAELLWYWLLIFGLNTIPNF